MKSKIIELLHPGWPTWSYSEKKDYLLMVKKVLDERRKNEREKVF